MKTRILLALFCVLFVTACGDDSKDAMNESMSADRDIITTTDPMGGYDSQNLGSGDLNQDLVTTAGDRVFFGYDEYNLSDDARNTLSLQTDWLSQYPNVNIVVEGHADERGTREYNLALAERRATSVKNYLIASGVNPSRVRVISYGKERPAVAGSTPSAWAQNRRSVTVVE